MHRANVILQLQASQLKSESHMSDKDRSFSGSKFGKSNIGSMMNHSHIESHIKSTMPFLSGGKKEDQIKYVRFRVQQNLQYQKEIQQNLTKNADLNQVLHTYYDFKKFSSTDDLLKQDITQNDLFYIFVKEQLASWAEKFSQQESKESGGKKTIYVVQFLKKASYEKKLKPKDSKSLPDPYSRNYYYVNSDQDWMAQMQDDKGLFVDIITKLKIKLNREGDRKKTLALTNKFKQQKTKRERLYIYVEDKIKDKLGDIYKKYKKKNGFKWTQIEGFKDFNGLMLKIKDRQEEAINQATILSQISISPGSKMIIDKSMSYLKSTSYINGQSVLSGKTYKDIAMNKNQTTLRKEDKNFIIHSESFPENDKIYQYVMGQKDNNWQRVIFKDKDYRQINVIMAAIEKQQAQNQHSQFLKIVEARNLYILTYSLDSQTAMIHQNYDNINMNRSLADYNGIEDLRILLTKFTRDNRNYTIVIVHTQGNNQDEFIQEFKQKHQITDDNLCVKYRNKLHEVNQSLSMNSKLSNNLDEVDRFLRNAIESRDKNFNFLDCFGQQYVYLLVRADREEQLIDNQINAIIGKSARLKKTTYQDANYLHQTLKGYQLSGNQAIILAEDNALREAQQVALNFDNAFIMNITDRKKVKDQKKVVAWGTHENIKQVIKRITQKFRILQRRTYKKDPKTQYYRQNPLTRRLPKYIDFKQGSNVTVKLSAKEVDRDSQVMQHNLNFYFKQQIRIQQYNNPDQIRLVNKVQQPLTFIICRDDEKQLQYMKSIAKNSKDDLRQQYILFTNNPTKYEKEVFDIPKYERFRFVSNSWKKIQQYIIGIYEMFKKGENKNDQIYEDEVIHVFYHPEDFYLKDDFLQNYKNSPAYNNVRFYDVSKMEWIALQQSPYHLYYLLVNQANVKFNSTQALKQIKTIERNLQMRNVPPKNIMMLVLGKKAGVVKDDYTRGIYENSQQLLSYISGTKIYPPKLEITKPHIIIDKKSVQWYYFLDKNKDKNRYYFYFVDNLNQANKIIEQVRQKQVGSQFWYIANNPKDLTNFLQSTSQIQKGNQIFGIYQGVSPQNLRPRVKFQSQNPAQIQSFIINAHKRSHTIFCPDSLRTKNPILAISKQKYQSIPIDPIQIQKWRQDLSAQQLYFDRVQEVRNLPKDRNVFLITDYQQDQIFSKIQPPMPNVWKIIYDSNYSPDLSERQRLRLKAHKLYKIYPNSRQLYYGFYPAQIRHYLRYLRYNIKNSPQKLKSIYKSQLTNIYMPTNLNLKPDQQRKLLNHNHSIANIYTYGNTKLELQKCINHALSNKNYSNVILVTKQMASIIQQHPNKNLLNYIIYNQDYQNPKLTSINSQLLTDQNHQYVNYLFNLPQNRYQNAKRYKINDPLKLLYLNNGTLTNPILQLQKISKRNNNFVILNYNNIKQLSQYRQDGVVLVDQNSYMAHLNQLGRRDNLSYFVLSSNKDKDLVADKSKSEHFVTKQIQELYGYFNNFRRIGIAPSPIKPPDFSPPIFYNNLKNARPSRPLYLSSGIDLNQLKLFPPFKKKKPDDKPDNRKIPINFVDSIPNNPTINFIQDKPLRPIYARDLIKPLPQVIINPLPLNLDSIPGLIQDKFNSKADNIITIPRPVLKPGPKIDKQKLAIIYPQNREYKQIFRVLQSNLSPATFRDVQGFPYMSQYDLQNILRNQNKLLGFDRTVVFINPRNNMEQIKTLKNKLRDKIQFFTFSDYFHRDYSKFKQFLQPYIIRNNDVPYINKQDPSFWLQTNLYNIMVPINKKKYYNSLKSQNVAVLPYNDDVDIQSQLHRNNQFVIIVCDKKNYHDLKKFTRMSPRCIIVIEDNQQLKQDEVPLFRFPKKVLYYGNQAINYLKVRIPSKSNKIVNQPMKVIFYKKDNPNQIDFALQEQFNQYEKVQYVDAQDLFIKLIDPQFIHSANYKVPQSLKIADKVKLLPKIYLHKNSLYRNDNQLKKFISDYSKFSSVHEKQFKKSFKNVIKPQQYKHLPTVQYDTGKQLKAKLVSDQTPSLVFLDLNNYQQTSVKQGLLNRHLFIEMFDVYDIWIDRHGILIPPQQLSRQQLAVKHNLFIEMFSREVFDEYNDMGFYYLSNAYKVMQKKVRNITFMTRQQLVQQFNKHPNLLMVVFVEHTDRKFIPKQFYDMQYDTPKSLRVKLIFIHTSYVHNQNILYIKYNEIDPVFYHINAVQQSSRTNYCVFPSNKAGNVRWHHFAQRNKNYKPIQFQTINGIDNIALSIKGSFQHVHVICEKQDKQFIKNIFAHYSIKTKPNSNERVTFQDITQADMKSYIGSANKSKMPSNINFNPNDEKQKFETVGHQVDVKPSSVNALYNSNINANGNNNNFNNSNNQPSLQSIVQSKNFIINLNEKLKDNFPVGNLYTNGVKHFKSLSQIDLNSPLNQIIVTDQNLNDLKNALQNNQKLYLVYVNDSLPAGSNGNSIIIKENQIPKFISQLQNIQKGSKNQQIGLPNISEPKIQQMPTKNVQDFKVIKVFYDQGIIKQEKIQILLSSLKKKNIKPLLFRDVDQLKKLMKEQDSLTLLLISNQPPNLDEQLQKQNYKIIKNKKGKKMVVPKYFNPGIDGLSTILQQDQTDLQHISQAINQHVDAYLTIMQTNPQKGRKHLTARQQKVSSNPRSGQQQLINEINQLQKQDSDKLNVHSNINFQAPNDLINKQWLKQRLDGGVIVLFAEINQVQKVTDLKKKYNVLLQQYKHLLNLNNSIRQQKDRFIIVLVDPTMLNQVKNIKQQHPKTIFVLVNNDKRQIPAKDKVNISMQINNVQQIEPVIKQIYQVNQILKYSDPAGINKQSKIDNKRTSYVDNGNSWRLSTGYHNNKVKNIYIFYKENQNQNLKKKVQNVSHVTFVPYKDLADAQKKFNSHSGYQHILIANDKDIPQFQDYITKKKQQTYVIKLNPPQNLPDNPKIRLLLSAYSEDEVSNFLIDKFGQNTAIRSHQKPKQGKSYAPRYQPNTFGTTPRFTTQQDYVPYKNDPIYSSRGIKNSSRESKVLRSESNRDLQSRNNNLSPYYNH